MSQSWPGVIIMKDSLFDRSWFLPWEFHCGNIYHLLWLWRPLW